MNCPIKNYKKMMKEFRYKKPYNTSAFLDVKLFQISKSWNSSTLSKSTLFPLFFLLFIVQDISANDCFFGNLIELLENETSITSKSEYTKVIKKEFPIEREGTVELSNKYGKIDVKTWEKNRVKIEVNIIVKTHSESEAQEVFERIRIDYQSNEGKVGAKTFIESKKTSWWDWEEENTEFQINYQVFMPQTSNLKLTNKYGDADIMALQGEANINIEHGNFTLAGISDDLELDLSYGAGLIHRAEDIRGEVAYAKLRIVEAEDINLETHYSKMTVERVADLEIESRYDNYEVGSARDFKCKAQFGDMLITSVANVQCNSHYTEYHIERVDKKADFNLKYGGVVVEQIAKGFSEVILVGKYVDYQLTVPSDANFQLDADGEYAGIRYPQSLKVNYEVEKSGHHAVKGYHGSGNSGSIIKANLNYGGLKVKNE